MFLCCMLHIVEGLLFGFCRAGRNRCADLYAEQLSAWHERGFKLPDIYWKQSRIGKGKKNKTGSRLNQFSPSIRLQFLQCGFNWTVTTRVMMWSPKRISGVTVKTRNHDARTLEPEQDRGLCWIKCWNYYKQLYRNCKMAPDSGWDNSAAEWAKYR